MRSATRKRQSKSRRVCRRHALPRGRAIPAPASPRQGGVVIIVVLALLTTLLFLGVFQLRWTGQEEVSAGYYVAGEPLELEQDRIFAIALRQLIVGVPDEYANSALNATDSRLTTGFGSANVSIWSMLANQIGPVHASGVPLDMQPHNGPGINLLNATGPGAFDVDYDGDGVADNLGLFRLNLSPMAGAVDIPSLLSSFHAVTNPNVMIQLDAGYTYPDVNSIFLAMDYVDPATNARVIKPSFTLPRYFANPTALSTIQSLRIHTGHTALGRSYISPSAVAAESGDTNRVIPPYIQPGNLWGVYQGASTYDLDGDADGDGIDDSVDIDLGHGIIDLPGGRQVVPIFHIKVVDQDALLNTNAVGNQSLLTLLSNNALATPAFAYLPNFWLHSSNMGIARSEINPQFALQADASNVNYVDAADVNWATAPLRAWVANRTGATPVDITGGSLSRLQSANIELARMLYGAPDFFADDLRYAGTSDLEGRYGTDNAGVVSVRNFLGNVSASSGAVPSPGQWSLDDDRNSQTILGFPPTDFAYRQNGHGGHAYMDTVATSKLRNVAIPPFVHPLDYSGLGGLLGQVNTGNDQRLVGKIDANSPVNWPQYPAANLAAFGLSGGEDLNQYQGVSTNTLIDDGSGDTYADLNFRTIKEILALQPGSSNDSLVNHPSEMNLHTDLGTGSDNPFSISEIAALQLSDSDWSRLGAVSRLRKLLPLNFENNKQASFIRGHFTTSSWDRLEFGMSRFASTTERLWEFNNQLALTAADLTPNDLTAAPGTYRAFPPQFGTVIASRHDRVGTTGYVDITAPTTGAISANDPFRPELRRLLTTFRADDLLPASVRNRFPHHRLNINRILSDDVLAGGGDAFDAYGNPLYRELVPHVVEALTITTAAQAAIVNAAMIHDNLTQTAYNAYDVANHPISDFSMLTNGAADANDKYVQEWWARYDRQRLARDIYVLLYTLGGEDSVDPTTPPSAHSAELAQQMAQFAVNYVDALDRDDCITKFEYDPDLSDGWQAASVLDVYGIERQQLTFSEALLLKAPKALSDFASTLHDESVDDHRWVYLELRNVSPFAVRLTEGFRIVRVDTVTTPATEVPKIAAEFRPVGGTHKVIQPGLNFLVASHDGTILNAAGQPIGSEFVVDHTGTSELDYVVPRGITVSTVVNNSSRPDPLVEKVIDFDLNAYDQGANSDDKFVTFNVLDPAWTYSGLVEATPGGGSGQDVKATFTLQRRLNPYLTWSTPAPTDDDAEWVEVDRLSLTSEHQWIEDTTNPGTMLEGMEFKPDMNGQANNLTALTKIKSQERDHHFTYSLHKNPGAGPQNFSLYSIAAAPSVKHAANDYLVGTPPASIPDPANINIWQPHFDRDFSSAIELLSLPLYGYRGADNTTEDPIALATAGATVPMAAPAPIGGVTYNLMDNSSSADVGHYAAYNTAQMRFLFPSGDANAGHPFNGVTSDGHYPNRWYRLFEFLQIPDMSDDVVETALRYKRRTPGKINANTLRHEAVLAGLVDDDVHFDINDLLYDDNQPTQDMLEPSALARNWMRELQFARDRDFVTIGTDDVILPGSPVAKPFRPFSYIDSVDPATSVESTLLRLNENAVGTADLEHLGLFEARPIDDVGTEAIDPHTRNRLLAKVANNTTVRSHVFGVWIGFELHEAHQTAAGQVQIGGKATDLPGYRMFCVVDMSRLEEAYDPINGTFDFRKFIVHQQLLP